MFIEDYFEVVFNKEEIDALIKDLSMANRSITPKPYIRAALKKVRDAKHEEIKACTISDSVILKGIRDSAILKEARASVNLDHGDVQTICESD